MRQSIVGRRWWWSLGAVALTLLAFGRPDAQAPPQKPNIILVLADDFGMAEVSAYGGDPWTPSLDSMAAGGMRFQHAYAMPLCGPTRAALLTGRYGFRTGVEGNPDGANLRPASSTIIAKLLQSAGYATALAGKWYQLRYLDTVSEAEAWGFDEFMRSVPGSSQDDRASTHPYWGGTYNKNGVVTTHPTTVYGPDLVHDFVVDFIRRKKAEPFFLYYPSVLIHSPVVRTPDSPADSTTLYTDMVAYQDKLVGKLLAELDLQGIRQNTLVIFVGDNGSHSGSGSKQLIDGRKINGGKGSLREGGSRVPLIASWPGTTPGGVVSPGLVDVSDIYPTIAQIAGVPLPLGVTIDGQSFAHLLNPSLPAGPARSWVYVQRDEFYYVRNQPPGHKLYQDCRFVDMWDAPYGEIVIEPAQQQAVFDELNDHMRALRGVPCQ
jgi:arylsulfatase A